MSELDDLVRTRRFDEIHEARRQVIDDERAINEARATGRIDEARAKRLYQRAVDAYVRELEYLLNPPNGDDEDRWWHDEKIGKIELPNDTMHVVAGLGEYLDLPEQLAVEVRSYEREHYYQLGDPATNTVRVQPSWRLLESAFRTANAAVTDLGLELDISDGDSGPWEFRKIKDVDDIDPAEWNDLSVFDNGDSGEKTQVSDD